MLFILNEDGFAGWVLNASPHTQDYNAHSIRTKSIGLYISYQSRGRFEEEDADECEDGWDPCGERPQSGGMGTGKRKGEYRVQVATV